MSVQMVVTLHQTTRHHIPKNSTLTDLRFLQRFCWRSSLICCCNISTGQ